MMKINAVRLLRHACLGLLLLGVSSAQAQPNGQPKSYAFANLLIHTLTPLAPDDSAMIDHLQRYRDARNPDGSRTFTGVVVPVLAGAPGDYDGVGIGSLLDGLGFRRVGITITFASADISSDDPDIRAAGIAFLKERIDICKAIGATALTGPIVVPEQVFPVDELGDRLQRDALVDHMEQRYRNAVAPMREVAQYAASKGIQLGHEYITHWEIPGQNTLAQAIAFALEVNHPAFGLLTDTSHEVHNGHGPFLWAGLMKLARDRAIPLFVQVSEPGRSDVRNSWIPWETFFGVLQELEVINQNHPLDIEVFDNIPGFEFLSLTRRPFADPTEVMIGGGVKSAEEWRRVNGGASRIPRGALEAARDLVARERQMYR